MDSDEHPVDIDSLLAQAQGRLRDFDRAVNRKRLIKRVKKASPTHPVLLTRAGFIVLTFLAVIAALAVLIVPLVNPELARVMAPFDALVPGLPEGVPRLPAVLGLLALCMFVAYFFATLAAQSIGRETRMLPWEQRQHQALVNEVTRLNHQKAVMERGGPTGAGAKPRIATPVPVALRDRTGMPTRPGDERILGGQGRGLGASSNLGRGLYGARPASIGGDLGSSSGGLGWASSNGEQNEPQGSSAGPSPGLGGATTPSGGMDGNFGLGAVRPGAGLAPGNPTPVPYAAAPSHDSQPSGYAPGAMGSGNAAYRTPSPTARPSALAGLSGPSYTRAVNETPLGGPARPAMGNRPPILGSALRRESSEMPSGQARRTRFSEQTGFPGTPEPPPEREAAPDEQPDIFATPTPPPREYASYGDQERWTAAGAVTEEGLPYTGRSEYDDTSPYAVSPPPARRSVRITTQKATPPPSSDAAPTAAAMPNIVDATTYNAEGADTVDDYGSKMTTRLPRWGRIDEPWLEQAIERVEAMAKNLPMQAHLEFSQEENLPFTMIIARATPAMAVRATLTYVEFLASIPTPPHARIELVSVAHLDRGFHRNVRAALEPYFRDTVEVEANPGRVDITFLEPDPCWHAYPKLPLA